MEEAKKRKSMYVPPCMTEHGKFKDRPEVGAIFGVPDEEFERIFGPGSAHRLNIMSPEERKHAGLEG